MSRTEKDAPWWYRAEWWSPSHANCQYDTRSWRRNDRDCDLPDAPTWEDAPRGYRRAAGCQWWPDSKFRCTCDYCNRRYRRELRASDRDYCRVAVTEHRATGDVCTEPPHCRPIGLRWCDY